MPVLFQTAVRQSVDWLVLGPGACSLSQP
uniref:Uncharacterized protein n=1 Tax=Anguilla anguilla TaxID=7936 RepID=A0A0E9PK33_ANGAN